MTRILAVALLAVANILALHAAQAQAGIKRSDVLRQDLGLPGREVI